MSRQQEIQQYVFLISMHCVRAVYMTLQEMATHTSKVLVIQRAHKFKMSSDCIFVAHICMGDKYMPMECKLGHQ